MSSKSMEYPAERACEAQWAGNGVRFHVVDMCILAGNYLQHSTVQHISWSPCRVRARTEMPRRGHHQQLELAPRQHGRRYVRITGRPHRACTLPCPLRICT